MTLVHFGILSVLTSMISLVAQAVVLSQNKTVPVISDGQTVIHASKIRQVPATSNRFDNPWYVHKRVRFPTLEESRYRVLYSPLRGVASDGLGHNSGVMNAEIGIALRLGLTYTHRVSLYGSLTRDNPNAVENFFGWGHGQIPREFIRESFCKSSGNFSRAKCQPCEGLKSNSSFHEMKFHHLVEIPYNLTYGRMWCSRSGSPLHESSNCMKQANDFVERHNQPYTIFQMPLDTCASNPVDSFFDPVTRAYLFNQYWDRHGSRSRYSTEDDEKKSSVRFTKEGIPLLRATVRRRPISYPEHALNIAIHARRGDFFMETRRSMVSTAAFGRTVRDFMTIVQKQGGVFSRMPVIVHLYSEGINVKGSKYGGHDVSGMAKSYKDSDGTDRDAGWVTKVIRGIGLSEPEVQSSVNSTSASRKNAPRLSLFPGGLKVQLHIATNTLQSLHEMIAADMFIGSASGMSMHVVATMSRGVHLVPSFLTTYSGECCHSAFDPQNGGLHDPQSVAKFWKAFTFANEASATRAYYLYKRRRH
ncbi:hypothetical protein BWQ96_03253 [Gracilariopsis chorda]|uniref:EGF domain-specific O-linked N-acetylglucosamine transferase n=1 Tax=Gracilariopsis chorda TaxID=448386 RepID=A0A2V3IXX1_9FLOR|nr:hypothetical protein BWQ96_03253 [Gracilariopsis chorda]|eukprot:PXF46915.1 hypothetical protein BWQ96_03253 [Gracilariopsis chorda]